MLETDLNAHPTPIQQTGAPTQAQLRSEKIHKQPLQIARYSEGMAVPDLTRLVVLVPDRDVDETAFARKIWALLGRRRVSILLITIVTNSDYGPGAQRRLATLAAVTRDIFYQIETRVIFHQAWISALSGIVGPGDLVACHDTQRSRSFPRKDIPLADLILSRLEAPVYVLSGLYREPVSPRPSRLLRQVVFWGILVGILTAFFLVEADIDQLTTGWISSLLFILVFAVEIIFIWLWNFLRI